MEDILTDLGIWEYAQGTIPMPPQDKKEEFAKWKKFDRFALTTIRHRVSDPLVIYINAADTAAKAWTILREIFESKGPVSIIVVRRKLYRAQCDENGDLEAHVRMLRGYQSELTTLGQTFSEEEFSTALLTSLPDSWDSFISTVSLDALKESDKLIARIFEEDRRRRAKNPTVDSGLAARDKRRKKFNPHITCHKCGMKGHIKPECPNTDGPGDQRNFYRSNVKRYSRANVAVDEATFMVTGIDPGFSADAESDSEFPAALASVAADDWRPMFTGSDPAVSAASESDSGLSAALSTSWLADSGASSHMLTDRKYFMDYRATPGYKVKGLGQASCLGRGTAKIHFRVGTRTFPVTLKDCAHVPDSPHNLISLSRVTDAGFNVTLEGDYLRIFTPSGNQLANGIKSGRLYFMDVVDDSPDISYVAKTVKRTLRDWHEIMGHINATSLKILPNVVTGMELASSRDPPRKCEACIQAKQHVTPFPKESSTKIRGIGDLTLTDVWGPARTTTITGDKYFITFTDAKTRRTIIYLMKAKTEALAKFKHYKAFMETQTDRKLKKLRADNGTEYVNKDFKDFLAEHGILLQTTAPHSSAQNGIAERLNRTLVENARAMLISQGLPHFFWGEAILYATYLKNRSPHRALNGKTPEEIFSGTKPNIAHLERFGAKCWVLQQDVNRNKLDPKSKPFIFTGFSGDSRAYRYFNPVTRQIQTSRNVIFSDIPTTDDEVVIHNSPTSLEGERGRQGELTPENTTDASTTPTTAAVPAPASQETDTSQVPRRRSTRVPIEARPNYRLLHNPAARKAETIPEVNDIANIIRDFAYLTLNVDDEPLTIDEARARADRNEWDHAMEEEIRQLHGLGTWTLTKLPEGRKAVPCKWVYRRKKNSDGSIARYKARLVAKGFSQIPGIDFTATYAPALRLESLRTIMAIAAKSDLETHHMDVKSAYLNGTLTEEIYMEQPPGFSNGTDDVCRLHKSIYGLKQSGRIWNQRLHSAFIKLNYTRSDADHCLYSRIDDTEYTIIGVHVDDLTIATSHNNLTRVKDELKSCFEMTDLGECQQIVGIEMRRDRGSKTIGLFQSQYIDTILTRFGMENSKLASTPLDPNVKLIPRSGSEQDPKMKGVPYQEAIGSLMYAALGTRPDISFAVQHLSQFSSNPSPAHWTAVKRVLRYLNNTRDFGIIFDGNSDHILTGYTDSDWGSNLADRKSISGYIFHFNGPVSWNSKKQPTVALSSMEAEYIAISHATREAVWLRHALSTLGFPQTSPSELNADNQAALSFSNDEDSHRRTKHIDIRHHFVREKVTAGEITTNYVPSKDNCADLLTKPFPATRHWDLMAQIGMATDLRGSVSGTRQIT